uniref:Uncharacterized protein n=1 Tax=uncultured alpha proteobacterium HF0070_14E07 TaxID=710804 RepID=E0XS64_9PROT|nr:hypothetical protein [uncultured alpha proteobacterium HF0070_14E07]
MQILKVTICRLSECSFVFLRLSVLNSELVLLHHFKHKSRSTKSLLNFLVGLWLLCKVHQFKVLCKWVCYRS